MDEKIKELAEQAGSTHKPSLGVYQFYTGELEKFAELIIKDMTRQPLSEEEIDAIKKSISKYTPLQEAKIMFARAIEKAHGIGVED